jgi:PD-(D/E)XK nuclease superfamily
MSEYYKTKRSADWNYGGPKWKLSRSKIDLFMDCPRCFYIDNKLGLARPKGPSFTLNVAVDALLKKEFDIHRDGKTAHPLMAEYGVNAVPFPHEELDHWRDNFTGIQYFHEPTGFLITGAIDDVWKDPKGNLIIVDYKATSKDGKLESLDDTKWQTQYKRQMEIYQWLFRKNGFSVSDTGYFVYVNGRKDKKAFDGKLEFDVTLIAHKGKDDWIDGELVKIKKCLDDSRVPGYTQSCDFCRYVQMMGEVLREKAKEKEVGPAPESKSESKPTPKAKSKLAVKTPKLF